MADHSKPTVLSTETGFVAELDSRLDDLAKMLDATATAPTNLPVDAVRRNGLDLQRWTGSTWVTVAKLNSTDAAAALTALGVSAFMRQLLDDADAVAARATLGINNSFVGMAFYTSSATFTAPAGVTRARVIVVGGGAHNGAYGNSPGGNGGCTEAIVTLTPGAAYTITVGAAGISTAVAGGTSSAFGLSATGGGGTFSTDDGLGSGGVINSSISLVPAHNYAGRGRGMINDSSGYRSALGGMCLIYY